MKKKIELTDVEQKMRRLLIEMAAGVKSRIVHKKIGITFLNDFKEFRERFHLSQEQLVDSLERISIYDTYMNSNAPLLEMLLDDVTGHCLGIPNQRESATKLLDEYETYWPDKEKCNSVYWRLIENKDHYPNRLKSYALRKTFEESAEREKVMAEWYWRVNRSIPDRLIKSINNEHIVADIELLQEWTEEDIAAIAMRTIARGKYIKLRIRYILLEKEPTFHYAQYGDFFFRGNRLYVIVKQKDEYTPFRNEHVEKWLQEQSVKAPISSEKSFSIDCPGVACQTMVKGKDIVIEAVFAGIQTNMKDSNTHRPIFTGDIIAVKGDDGSSPAQTVNALADAMPPHYVLPLDNCAFDLTPELHNQKYYKAGSVFFNLSPYIELNEVYRWFDGVLSLRGEPSDRDKKILRAKMKASPCYEQEDWEWLAGIKLGIYNS